MANEKLEKWPEVKFVCKGKDFLNGELHVVIAEVNNDGTLKDNRYFEVNKNTKGFYPGAVYLIESHENSIRAATAKWQKMWPDQSQVAAWQAATRSAETLIEMRRKEKREASGDQELLELLLPLRKQYSKIISGTRQTAFELAVLRALRRPVRTSETKEDY